MHLTSLPGKYGIGDLGTNAKKFAQDLAQSGVRFWQILPLGPTGFGNSPYSSQSAFAGNELLISLEELCKEGFLSKDEINNGIPAFVETTTNFNAVRKYKMPLLFKAAERALKDSSFCKELALFKEKNAFWLEDYALFSILYEKYNSACWRKDWPEDVSTREPSALKKIKEDNYAQFEERCAIQYFFEKQLAELHTYAASLNLALIGDIPIFVGMDSADTWASPFLFKRDEKGVFSDVTGVPPDNFSKTGQLWGNPAYDWDYHVKTNFQWWISRIKRCLQMTDVIRIDHFRGFSAYYNIKATEKTAEHGEWKKSPGDGLFENLEKALGKLNIIAEDLGNITEDVIKLRLKYGFPGMKIAQFGFAKNEDGSLNTEHDFLPDNYEKNFVAYTGTHDNDTTSGWFESLDKEMKALVCKYLNSNKKTAVQALIEKVAKSKADLVVIPMQDILNLDSSARMNYPSTCNDKNWSWRMKEGAFSERTKAYLKQLIEQTGR